MTDTLLSISDRELNEISSVGYVAIGRYDTFLVSQVQETGCRGIRTCFQVWKGALEVEM